MLEWIVAAGLFALLIWAIAAAHARARRKPRKGGGGGVVLALGMTLASAFDPARSASTEIIDRKRETENSEERESGAPPD